MSSRVRQHKSPYFYVRKGAGFVLLENHVETGTRYRTEAEAKRAVLALNDAWRAKGAKSNPRRRNPAAEAEMVLWARPAGQTDALYEQPIYTQGRTMEDIERVKKLAAKEGWHTFRVQRIDLSKPYNAQKEFAATIRGSRRRNPPMRRNYSDAPMIVWHDEKPSFGVDRDHVATHGKHTYIIYQHPRDGSSVFHIDRETKGMPPYPMGSRSTLTKAKEAAQQDLEGLEAARSGYPERQNPRKADQAEVQGEVLHLLVTAEIGGGRELDALAEILKSGMPLSVSDIEVATEAAESRLEDAEYELKTDRIREHKERNRQDRDHYRKLLKAIKRLTPTRVSNPRTRSR